MSALGATLSEIDKSISDKKKTSAAARAQIDSLQEQLDAATAEYQQAYSKLVEIEQRINATQRLLNSAVEQQEFYQSVLNQRSVFAYRNHGMGVVELLVGARSFRDFVSRVKLLGEISERDAEVLSASKKLKGSIEKRRNKLSEEKRAKREVLALISDKQDSISQLIRNQQVLLTKIEGDIKGLETDRKRKVEEEKRAAALAAAARANASAGAPASMAMLFPIPAPYSHSYTNDWGFARAGNPAGHQGTDIFAAKGTPVIAVVDGVIGENYGYLNIGGWRMWVIGDNGYDYYYAHLNNDSPGTDDNSGGASTAYAPGIKPGVRVKAGQVIGYVGDSGDAEPTPAHVHFGITPRNGDWINPYPYLIAADWK